MYIRPEFLILYYIIHGHYKVVGVNNLKLNNQIILLLFSSHINCIDTPKDNKDKVEWG
jgi:hypothetical protein